MRHRYHVLYKTTCIATGSYYVGIHSTNDLKDGYQGSGKILLASIRKYGRKNHYTEVMQMTTSREELLLLEKTVVNDQMLSDPRCMNLVVGGNTSGHEYDRNPESAKMQAASLRVYFTDISNRQRLSKSVLQAYTRPEVRAHVAKKLTEEQVREIRQLYALTRATFAELGKKFNVSGSTIWMIVTYRTWKNVS